MNKFLEYVDKAYCINLDRRPDRWKKVSETLRLLGAQEAVRRFSAIEDDDPRVGCLESHIECVRKGKKEDAENILILEDDVAFFDIDQEVIEEVIRFLQRDSRWELFYLGGMVMSPARFKSRNVFRARFFSTHAYIINRRAFEKMFSATPPIDIWYAWNLVSYGLYPMYATQAESYSDIRKKIIANREDSFTRRYQMLVEPNYYQRWVNYFRIHYLQKYFSN